MMDHRLMWLALKRWTQEELLPYALADCLTGDEMKTVYRAQGGWAKLQQLVEIMKDIEEAGLHDLIGPDGSISEGRDKLTQGH